MNSIKTGIKKSLSMTLKYNGSFTAKTAKMTPSPHVPNVKSIARIEFNPLMRS